MSYKPADAHGPCLPGFHLFSGSGSTVLCLLTLGTTVPDPHAGIEGLQLPASMWALGRVARSPCNLRKSGGLRIRNTMTAGRR